MTYVIRFLLQICQVYFSHFSRPISTDTFCCTRTISISGKWNYLNEVTSTGIISLCNLQLFLIISIYSCLSIHLGLQITRVYKPHMEHLQTHPIHTDCTQQTPNTHKRYCKSNVSSIFWILNNCWPIARAIWLQQNHHRHLYYNFPYRLFVRINSSPSDS